MNGLFRKELISFFGSLTGYLIAWIYLVATSLFLWVFPGQFNIIDAGYASLTSYFQLAPWLLLFLIPALTMRSLAEEKKLGTLEILLTRPVSFFKIIGAKYLASIVLVICCLLPTLIYFYSVYILGNPIGNWDSGAAWGSFIGLFLLAALYVSIGVFCSSVTDNQILSFLFSLLLSYIFYGGFSLVATADWQSSLSGSLSWLSIQSHYYSLSRGVVDSKDVAYFIFFILVFLLLATYQLERGRLSVRQIAVRQFKALAVGIVLLILANLFFFRLDLTKEKRFELADVSKSRLEKLNGPVTIECYLAGDLPAGFRNFQKAIVEKIEDMNAWSSSRIRLKMENPYAIENEKQRNALFAHLSDMGLIPTDLRLKEEQGTVTRLLFPGVIIYYGGQQLAVNLLKNNPTLSGEQNLNNSIETLEFEFIRAFRRLQGTSRKLVAFLHGQNELNSQETYEFRSMIDPDFDIIDCHAEELFKQNRIPNALIIADPKKTFSTRDKYIIDQYAMHGGRILWMVDPVQVSLDSLSRGETTLAFPRDLNLRDQLFHYGVRLNTDLIQDVECLMIPVNTAPVGASPKFTPVPWYYSPLLVPSNNHVISRDLNRVKAEFVSSIDTVGRNPDLHRSVILQSSTYARKVLTPEMVSLQSINNPPARELFNVSNIPVGVLLEGKMTSVFQHRLIDDYRQYALPFRAEIDSSRMIVLSDGNLMANKVSYKDGKFRTQPLGYDQYSQQTFGNGAFLVNALNYLCDEDGLMSLRSRVFKIRLLDKVRLREEKVEWQMINVIIPFLIMAVPGLIFFFYRKRKFRRKL